MIEWIPVSTIHPAAYNPREIGEEQFEQLKDSIESLGFVIPIIINSENNTIIAGHQRVNAAKAIGMKEVPAFTVKGCTVADEMSFNQLHNGVDVFDMGAKVDYEEGLIGFTQIPTSGLNIRCEDGERINALSRLIIKYGNVLCALVCRSTVIIHADYLLACKALGLPGNVSIIRDDLYDQAIKSFSQDYGVYSYKHLPRHTYVQGLAQLNRLTATNTLKSNLYTRRVFPYLESNKVKSILDFGCGKGEYISILAKKKKYRTVGLEFYHHRGDRILPDMGNRDIDNLIENIRQYGAFDVVVCDSVLNSVDSKEAELAVLRSLHTFAKDIVFISGRSLEAEQKRMVAKKRYDAKNSYTRFFDKDNFSAQYRSGQWYYQHFHNKDAVFSSCEEAGLEVLNYYETQLSWQAMCRKKRALTPEEIEECIKFEFTLPLPTGRYNRAGDVLSALEYAGMYKPVGELPVPTGIV